MNDLNERHLALARITDVLFRSDLELDDLPIGRQLIAHPKSTPVRSRSGAATDVRV